MIGALKRLAVALVEAAQRGAAMSATVIQRADFSLGVPHDNQRTQSQASGDEIIDVGDFTLVREIGPRPAENLRHLRFKEDMHGRLVKRQFTSPPGFSKAISERGC